MTKMTKAQAKRSIKTIMSKVMKLYSFGFMTTDDLIKITDKCERALKKLK